MRSTAHPASSRWKLEVEVTWQNASRFFGACLPTGQRCQTVSQLHQNMHYDGPVEFSVKERSTCAAWTASSPMHCSHNTTNGGINRSDVWHDSLAPRPYVRRIWQGIAKRAAAAGAIDEL